ncbi:MAG: site-2 protease family protein [Peptococcaceae bacterium]|nr:site-2 protease family protein [Peptococcaceae bacterium]
MDVIIEQVILLAVIVFSLSCHECSHGLVAYRLGDPTAKNQGRLTLNPLKHVDPIGLLMLLIAKFGWAKPVPVDPRNFTKSDMKTGMLLTALAGPMANLLLVFLGTLVVSLVEAAFFAKHYYFWLFMNYFIVLNANLAFFNLLPVPPLDGSKILFGILPDRFYPKLYQLERYGNVILLLLIITGATRLFIQPMSSGIIQAFFDFFAFIGAYRQ